MMRWSGHRRLYHPNVCHRILVIQCIMLLINCEEMTSTLGTKVLPRIDASLAFQNFTDFRHDRNRTNADDTTVPVLVHHWETQTSTSDVDPSAESNVDEFAKGPFGLPDDTNAFSRSLPFFTKTSQVNVTIRTTVSPSGSSISSASTVSSQDSVIESLSNSHRTTVFVPTSSDMDVKTKSFGTSSTLAVATSTEQVSNIVGARSSFDRSDESRVENPAARVSDARETSTSSLSSHAALTNVSTPSPNVTTSGNGSSESPTMKSLKDDGDPLGIGAIVGIVLGVLGVIALVGGVSAYFIYHRRFRSLSEIKYPTDNCGYVDDSLRVSYINNHIELPKESSEEMFSLDNDSFLNSLEAMTLQNYWADDAKNTKV